MLMKLDEHARRVLESLPDGEARLIRRSALAPDADDDTLQLACLRLRNIAVRYEELAKRARADRGATSGTASAEELRDRVELVRAALAVCRERLERGGSQRVV
jgi:hypothetical protein